MAPVHVPQAAVEAEPRIFVPGRDAGKFTFSRLYPAQVGGKFLLCGLLSSN